MKRHIFSTTLFLVGLLVLAASAIVGSVLLLAPTEPAPAPTQQVSATTPGTQAEVPLVPTAPPLAEGAVPTPAPTGAAVPTRAPTLTPAPAASFLHPQRFSYAPGMYHGEIQALLDSQPGPLKDVRFTIGDRSHSFAAFLSSQTSLYSFNPQVFLALLEQQSRLLSSAEPAPEQLSRAMGYEPEGGYHSGLYAQVRWAIIEMRHAVRDYANTWQRGTLPPLVFADNSRQDAGPTMSLTHYALARVLARTTTPDHLPHKLNAFLATYTRLFGDPRPAPTGWPPPSEPFLTSPMERNFRVTSFFDHDTPFLDQNGSLTSFWGTTEAHLSYDGHTGWDYAMMPPDAILAAADGVVVFAGNSDDGCGVPSRSVIIDHGNGYRTLYWHLHTLMVETGEVVGRGAQIGIAGATGCAFGPHLHFQVQYLGRDVDPYGWCGDGPDPWASNPAGQQSTWLWADMLNPCGIADPDTIVVDNDSPGFITGGEWQQSALGYGGDAIFTETSHSPTDAEPWQMRFVADTPAFAIWQAPLPHAGRYRVLAYIPYILNGLDDSQELRYLVRHSEGETEVRVNCEENANAWADLGTYTFAPADQSIQAPRVVLSTLAGDNGRGMWADAVVWIPEDAQAAGGAPGSGGAVD